MAKRGRPSKKNLMENNQVEEASVETPKIEEKQEAEVVEVQVQPVEKVVEVLKEKIAKIEEATEGPAKPVVAAKTVVKHCTNREVVAQNFARGWITVIPKYTPITVLSENGQYCTIMYQGRKYNIAKCYIN